VVQELTIRPGAEWADAALVLTICAVEVAS